MISEEYYMMLLARTKNINLKKKQTIVDEFENVRDFFELDRDSIKEFCLKNRINSISIIEDKEQNAIEKYITELHEKQINFISIKSELYPYLLKNIFDAPLGLYYVGDIPNDDLIKVSIVGSRKSTQYGSMNAYSFGRELASREVAIVSGMAVGIDSMAHKGAIDGKGKTIAILGCGVDVVYPASNTNLRNEIVKNGCIISEFPPKTPPYATNFPIRNRIISGMSDAIIVVEAAKRSGTIITVNQALEQGRDVYVIPGNIGNKFSEGTNNLIKEGATMLTHIDDILPNLIFRKKLNKIEYEKANKKIDTHKKIKQVDINSTKSTIKETELPRKIENMHLKLTPEEKAIYDCISKREVTTDEILLETKMTIQKIQYILTMLELGGHIKRIAGQKYVTAKK